jgi:hypothetical protein
LLAPVIVPGILLRLLGVLATIWQRQGELRHALQTLRQRQGELRHVLHTYRPYEFAPVNYLYLAESIRQRFDEFTPALIKLDFQLLADYRMKPEPVEVFTRYFLSSDGETFAGITCLLNSGGESLTSVLEDGTCIHTTSSKNPRPDRSIEPGDELWISYLTQAPIPDLYRHHVDTVKDLAAKHESRTLRFHQEQLREAMVYDQLIFCRWRNRHGDFHRPPPSPDFSTLRRPLAIAGQAGD